MDTSYKLNIEKFPTYIQVADINVNDTRLMNIAYQIIALKLSEFISNSTIPYEITFENNLLKIETYIDRDNSSYITANNLLTYSNFEYFTRTKIYKNFKTQFDNMVFLDSILSFNRSLDDWGFIVKNNRFKFAPYQLKVDNKNTIKFGDYDKFKIYQDKVRFERLDILKNIILKFKVDKDIDINLHQSEYVKNLLFNRAMLIIYNIKYLGDI